jgi:outer membrane protein assembly factor BamA
MYRIILIIACSIMVFPNIGDAQKKQVINEIIIQGNAKTKRKIVERELTFSAGDTIIDLQSKLSISQENLINTRLFHNAYIDVIQQEDYVNIIIRLEERWYFWPIPIFEYADANLATWVRRKRIDYINYGIILEKKNILGLNQKVRLKLRRGIREQYAVEYNIPMLFNFKDIGFHSDISYFRQKEIHERIENLAYIDIQEDKYIYHELRALFGINYRPAFFSKHKLYGGYRQYNYNKSIDSLFNKPIKTFSEYISLGYTFNYFQGDYIMYPLQGTKIKLNQEFGLGKENYAFTDFSFSTHKPLAAKWTFSYGINSYISYTKQFPYFVFAGQGKTWYIRGFEDYVYQNDLILLNRLQLKYTLLKRKQFEFDWIPSKKFNRPFLSIFLNGFTELGYATNFIREYDEQTPISIGVGIDLLTYYDWIGRIEAVYNNKNETWINLHWGYIF